uniref:centrosomal protein of 19 kDa-like isoform X2 n=1 Tax=Styela clava TaxID=7725 RepID=UPI001939A924|nr:centrosomal protein of 19 kDa-like isoform X2 [Styela clava]
MIFVTTFFYEPIHIYDSFYSSLQQTYDVARIAEDLKSTQRHRTLLNTVSQAQLERLLITIQGHMKGNTLEQSLQEAKTKLSVDPEKDLNLLGTREIERAKLIMNESFESHRIKPEDPGFQYDIEVDFGNNDDERSCEWDSDDQEEF